MTTGQRIKMFVDESGLSNKEFAKKSGITYPSLMLCAKDERSVGPKVYVGLFKMGGDLNYLLMGESKNVNKELQDELNQIKNVLLNHNIHNLKKLKENLELLELLKSKLLDLEKISQKL